MKIKITFWKIAAVSLLISLGNTVSADSNLKTKAPEGEAHSRAPEVSAAESKLSFRDMPYLKKGFIDFDPLDRNDGIPVGKLSQSADKGRLNKLAQEISNGEHSRFDSLLIAHKGELMFESYYNCGRINHAHPQASATKAYVSFAVGRAIQLGYLTMEDLDKPLVSFLNKLDRSKLAEGVNKITLHKALIMSTGVSVSHDQMKVFENNPNQLKGQGQVQLMLEHTPAISTKNQRFEYKRNDPRLVMQVLDAVVPGGAKDFIQRELLGKLDIEINEWSEDVSGLPMGPSMSSTTSRNMLKWGLLAANKGQWMEEQLIPAAYVEKAVNKIVEFKDEDIFFTNKSVTNPGYGYYWWQADLIANDKVYFSSSAQGGGGQYIVLIDALDLIVVTTAHDNSIPILQIIAERIIPAFIQ